MNNNIKEILELYKDDDIEYYNRASDLGYDKFLDCIINLQEENRILKELNVCVGCENNPDYKSRNEKAIKYIKENMKDSQLVFGINDINRLYKKNMNDLLNILQGSDKDE